MWSNIRPPSYTLTKMKMVLMHIPQSSKTSCLVQRGLMLTPNINLLKATIITTQRYVIAKWQKRAHSNSNKHFTIQFWLSKQTCQFQYVLLHWSNYIICADWIFHTNLWQYCLFCCNVPYKQTCLALWWIQITSRASVNLWSPNQILLL